MVIIKKFNNFKIIDLICINFMRYFCDPVYMYVYTQIYDIEELFKLYNERIRTIL